jgi:hypothetical protein
MKDEEKYYKDPHTQGMIKKTSLREEEGITRGNTFWIPLHGPYILAECSQDVQKEHFLALISMYGDHSGMFWTHPVKVVNVFDVSKEEWKKIIGENISSSKIYRFYFVYKD